MGLIKKIFSALFGFISGLLGGFAKVLGIGGKSDYYVELDASQSTPAEPAKAQSSPAPASAPEAAPVPEAAPAPAAPAPQPAMAAASAPKPAPVAAQSNGKVPSDATFAPDNLLTPSMGGRRRPGPSLSPYKNMARQMGASR